MPLQIELDDELFTRLLLDLLCAVKGQEQLIAENIPYFANREETAAQLRDIADRLEPKPIDRALLDMLAAKREGAA